MNKLQRLIFFRRSTLLNFLAILLIIGAVLALHAASKKFIFSDEKTATVQAPVEVKIAPAVAQAADTTAANKTEAASIESQPAPAPETEKPAAEEARPASKKHVAAVSRTRATRTRQSRWSEDNSYGVENLDSESARRRYMESNKDSSASNSKADSYSTYTMTETPPETVSRTYAYDDLDGAAARAQYRKETERLSKADLK